MGRVGQYDNGDLDLHIIHTYLSRLFVDSREKDFF